MTYLDAYLDGTLFPRTEGAYPVPVEPVAREVSNSGWCGAFPAKGLPRRATADPAIRVAVDDDGTIFADTGSGVFHSRDNGRTFTKAEVTPDYVTLLAKVAVIRQAWVKPVREKPVGN